MNDFTKEELEIIFSDVSQCDMEYSRSVEHDAVMSKIQFMIANYCEHESGEPRLVLAKECIKCNQHLETRPWGPG